jgi:disulfide bond formation protein DsbB
LRKLASILLILAFLGIGTGAIEYWHNLNRQTTSHDETNCPTHAILRAPMLLSTWAPLDCCIDVQIDRLIILFPSLLSQHTPTRIDCRGPPTC